jgi:hypothetical protein
VYFRLLRRRRNHRCSRDDDESAGGRRRRRGRGWGRRREFFDRRLDHARDFSESRRIFHDLHLHQPSQKEVRTYGLWVGEYFFRALRRELIDEIFPVFQRGSPSLGESVVWRGHVLAAVLSERSVPSIDCRPQKPACFRGCVRHLHPRSPPDPVAHGDWTPSILFWPGSPRRCSTPAAPSNAAQSTCLVGIRRFSAPDQFQQRQQSSEQRGQTDGLGWKISLG